MDLFVSFPTGTITLQRALRRLEAPKTREEGRLLCGGRGRHRTAEGMGHGAPRG